MNRISLFLLSVISCAGASAAVSTDAGGGQALEEVHPTLHWVGCGISKRAYMVALAKAYEEKTGVKIDLEGGGATRGIRDVAAASADMGGSCRRRIISADQERGVTQVPVAWDALVVIVNKENPVGDISLDNLRKVFLGQIKNWQELGGQDASIELFVRKGKISGVGRTARKLLFNDYEQEFAASRIFDSSGPLEQEIETNANAIAISGISSVRKRDVKILDLEGKSPSYENVQTGKYLLYRPLYIVYKEDSPNAATVKDFIRFADTEEGRAVIRGNGTVPYLEGLNLMKNKLEESRAARSDGGL
ncbi:MAG: substrate-binding domain-containing protein [Thiogranum sp.]|nr:substrate-binding domain-containing protein [Thiogranum sp.]